MLKWAGAKWRVAEWIASRLPTHETYLEPFFGSGAVFFSKDPVKIELLNDLDQNVVNLFRVIREQTLELADACAFTPWAQDEYASSVTALRTPFDVDNAMPQARLERVRDAPRSLDAVRDERSSAIQSGAYRGDLVQPDLHEATRATSASGVAGSSGGV
ncbi:MAG: DNA adenine methylase [Pleurocapsa sp. SU_196_0]|nr:DNA adenine methylase [Pleurocapsa sp. SU_196_0]